jgi:hypothetical protein
MLGQLRSECRELAGPQTTFSRAIVDLQRSGARNSGRSGQKSERKRAARRAADQVKPQQHAVTDRGPEQHQQVDR